MGTGQGSKNGVWDTMRSGAWLHPHRVRAYLWALAIANAASLAWLLLTSHGGLDPQGRLLGTDFVSFWAAGQVVHAGGNPYDMALHRAAESAVWPQQTGYTAFFYPPVFLLWCLPLGLAGYFTALVGWLIATAGAWLLAVRAWARRIDGLILAAFPPLLISITHGQTSLLLAALLGGGFLCAARGQSVLAGVLFGLAAFKPQFGVAVPLVLIAAQQWRVVAWAAVTVLTTAAMATLAFGFDIWGQWLAAAGPAQAAMAEGAVGFGKMQSLFSALRLLGLPVGAAYTAQIVLSVAVVVLLVRLAWRKGMTLDVGAASMTGALLATPFVLDYDFALLAFPLIFLARQESLPWERMAVASAFAVGAFARPLGVATGIPVGALVIAGLFWVLLRRAEATVAS